MAISGIKIEGLNGLNKMLGDLAPREARNLNRSTVHAIAGQVRKDARKKAPKDEGDLRKAIKSVRRRPRNPDRPFSDVRVEHGKNAKYDAFYWRFVEYGTLNQPEQPFLRPAVQNVRSRISSIYREEFMRKYERYLKRKAKRRGR